MGIKEDKGLIVHQNWLCRFKHHKWGKWDWCGDSLYWMERRCGRCLKKETTLIGSEEWLSS